ncbi:MAG: glucuronate isomerase [Eubacterium sp.]
MLRKNITGDASPKEKFENLHLCNMHGNPLYHWAHIELQDILELTLRLTQKLRMIFMSVQIRQLPMVICSQALLQAMSGCLHNG